MIELYLTTHLEEDVVTLVIAMLLGMFLGLEREWSQKSAGIRTFALISLLAAVFTIIGNEGLLLIGGLLIIAHAALLAVQSFIEEEIDGLSLTTSVSMLVAYSIGALVAGGFLIESVTVAVLSSLLLVLKRELHEFAWALFREQSVEPPRSGGRRDPPRERRDGVSKRRDRGCVRPRDRAERRDPGLDDRDRDPTERLADELRS
jgi:hypothetical protein